MSNILTLKRSIVGDSSYVPSLKLYDKNGNAVDASALQTGTKEKIELIAQQMFRKLEEQARGKTITTLGDRGFSVAEGEGVSLEDAAIDDEWDAILGLIAGDIGDKMSGPLESILTRTMPERVLALKTQAPEGMRILRKFRSEKSIDWQMQTFILMWLQFHIKNETGFAKRYQELVEEYDRTHTKT